MGAEVFVAVGAWTALGRVLDLRCACDATTNLELGACVACSRIRDWIYSLSSRSKRLSNVRSASARGSAWSGGQRQQHSPKKIDTRIGPRSRFRAFLCFFGARADPEFGDGTTTSEGDLHPQTCLSP